MNLRDFVYNILPSRLPYFIINVLTVLMKQHRNGDIWNLIRHRHALFGRFLYTQSTEDWGEYKVARNMVIKYIKQCKGHYVIKEIDSCNNDQRMLWQTLIIGKKKMNLT